MKRLAHTVAEMVARWSCSSACLVAGAAWGWAEGIWFFIVPDVLVTLAALFSLRRSFTLVAAVTAGSLVAGMTMFCWGAYNRPSAVAFVGHVPFVSATMSSSVQAQYGRHGVWALCSAPLSGIPYKMYAVHAAGTVDIVPFMLVSIPARILRFALSWAVFACIRLVFPRAIAARPLLFLCVHGAYWLAIYVFYWSSIA